LKKINRLVALLSVLLVVVFALGACDNATATTPTAATAVATSPAATSTPPVATPLATSLAATSVATTAATVAKPAATPTSVAQVATNTLTTADAPNTPVTGCGMGTIAGLQVDKAKLGKELNVYHWSDYIDPELLKEFERCYGVHVTLDTYTSNEELLTKIQGGVTGYDVAVPSDYMVGKMAGLNFLAEINLNNVPNVAGIDKRFRSRDFDPQNKYSLAYTWGTTGIAYDSSKVSPAPDSWNILFDPTYKGKIGLLDDSRETIGAALKLLGYSYNSVDKAQLNQAREKLIAQKPLIKAYDGTNLQNMSTGDIDIAQMYVGDALRVAQTRPTVKYFIPKEGSTIWQDNLVILKTAPHKYAAEVFLNFMLDPEISARNSNYIQYADPIPAAIPMIDKSLTSNKSLYPDQSVLDKQEAIKDLGDNTELYERIYTEVKNQ